MKPIEKIDGDKVVFLDKDGKPTIEKTKDEIVGKGEAPKAEGQEDRRDREDNRRGRRRKGPGIT